MRDLLTRRAPGTMGLLLVILAFVVVASSCSSDTVNGPAASASTDTGSFLRMSQRDTDGDGILDLDDADDDNDGVLDEDDADDDNDGILDDDEEDTDGDDVLDDHDDDYVELRGRIDSIGSDSFVAFGFTVLVDADTRIEGDNHRPLEFADLAEGMLVEVHGGLNDDTTILARKVEVEDGDDDGNGDDGDGDDDVPLSSLQAGDFVEAKGVADGQGGWMLTEVHMEWEHDRTEYTGNLKAIGGGMLTLLGLEFTVAEGIRFDDETDAGKTLSDLVEGDYVEVVAVVDRAAGSFTATRVRLEHNPEAFAKVEGEVFEVDAENGTIVVGGVAFHR